MLRAKVIFYDDRTGEVIGEEDRVLFVGQKPYADRNFVKIFVAFLRDILELEELGSGAWKLLLYVIDSLDYDSLEVTLDPRIVPKKLKVSRATFYRWLDVLLKYGILEKRDTRLYRLKPYTAIKGQMSKALETEPDF
jgi:predicted transcriptional regulator